MVVGERVLVALAEPVRVAVSVDVAVCVGVGVAVTASKRNLPTAWCASVSRL